MSVCLFVCRSLPKSVLRYIYAVTVLAAAVRLTVSACLMQLAEVTVITVWQRRCPSTRRNHKGSGNAAVTVKRARLRSRLQVGARDALRQFGQASDSDDTQPPWLGLPPAYTCCGLFVLALRLATGAPVPGCAKACTLRFRFWRSWC